MMFGAPDANRRESERVGEAQSVYFTFGVLVEVLLQAWMHSAIISGE